jgi:hypothetical protein
MHSWTGIVLDDVVHAGAWCGSALYDSMLIVTDGLLIKQQSRMRTHRPVRWADVLKLDERVDRTTGFKLRLFSGYSNPKRVSYSPPSFGHGRRAAEPLRPPFAVTRLVQLSIKMSVRKQIKAHFTSPIPFTSLVVSIPSPPSPPPCCTYKAPLSSSPPLPHINQSTNLD